VWIEGLFTYTEREIVCDGKGRCYELNPHVRVSVCDSERGLRRKEIEKKEINGEERE